MPSSAGRTVAGGVALVDAPCAAPPPPPGLAREARAAWKAPVSLQHAQGIPWARIGEQVGHADLVTTARTYTHVLGDEVELDYPSLVEA
jgi:hypothetical protein